MGSLNDDEKRFLITLALECIGLMYLLLEMYKEMRFFKLINH